MLRTNEREVLRGDLQGQLRIGPRSPTHLRRIPSAGVVLPKIPKKKERTGRPSKSLLVTQLQTLGQ